jgi:alpha-mannosidase
MRHKHPRLTLARAGLFFTRLCGKLLSEKIPVSLSIAGPVDRICREDALKLNYEPASLGHDLEPGWSTHWLKVSADIPAAWRGRTVVLRFHSGSEALLWLDGVPFHGFNTEDAPVFGDNGRAEAVLPEATVASGRLECEIEIACNGLWGASTGMGTPTSSRYKLYEVQLALRDEEVWKMAHDLVIPLKWLEDMPELKSSEPWLGQPSAPDTSRKLPPWPGRVLQLLNRFCNVCDSEDRSTWEAGRAVLREIYAHKNATFAHQITAVGHAHIDTAWLWPIAETKRKCSRSFSTALHIMDAHPSFRFVCSQAQQYAWMQQNYPGLYARIKAAAARGQWLPVGGTWIEPDCNVPSGESLVRQFLVGQRFFRREFGAYCREFWNPDVFGYSGALPQIMRGAGIEFFLTQKLSWNQFNKPRHQNFYWEGIDGSRVLTHFPPADTYNALDFGNLIKHFHQHERSAMDHDRVGEGMMLFGCGDGGGGATHHMMEVIERLEDFQGFPKVQTGRPIEFFERLKAELIGDEATVQVGELYFEYHRGTYTTQAATKRDNRRCERLLRDVEMLAALAHRAGAAPYPSAAVQGVWEKVLLNQFHDILPGSSIHAVYEDSARDYTESLATLATLKTTAAPAAVSGRSSEGHTLVNTLGWERKGVVKLPDNTLALASAPSCGYAPVKVQTPAHGSASAREENGRWILENGLLRAVFDTAGRIVSLTDLKAGRELVPEGQFGNRFVLFEDYPHAWDAWDVDPTHLEKFWEVPAHAVRIVQNDSLQAVLELTFAFGESRMTCRAILDADSPLVEFACDLDWKHRHRFLKVEFPVSVRAPEAAFEIQFGHVKRATHFNTSFDVARFESPAHFWADLSEEGYGVALLNDCKYGYAVHDNVLRLSLVRGTTSPDSQADQGQHTFRYAILPHVGTLASAEVVRRAQEFNTPWTILPGTTATAQSWLSVDSGHLILDTVKKAEDSDALIVRLYECHGARGAATLRTSLPFSQATRVNLLEETDSAAPAPDLRDGAIPLNFRPFEIITLKLQ